MNTKIEISISLESVVPTENLNLAEKIMLDRLRISLKHCKTLNELRRYFEGGNNEFNYSVQNEGVLKP